MWPSSPRHRPATSAGTRTPHLVVGRTKKKTTRRGARSASAASDAAPSVPNASRSPRRQAAGRRRRSRRTLPREGCGRACRRRRSRSGSTDRRLPGALFERACTARPDNFHAVTLMAKCRRRRRRGRRRRSPPACPRARRAPPAAGPGRRPSVLRRDVRPGGARSHRRGRALGRTRSTPERLDRGRLVTRRWLRHDPDWSGYRDDARFRGLLERLDSAQRLRPTPP
jgi:hypothetical protein